MPKIVARADYRFDKALGFLLKYRNMAIPDAMKLADFSAQEQACRAKRMCLYRLCDGGVGSTSAAVAAPRQSVCDSKAAAAGAVNVCPIVSLDLLRWCPKLKASKDYLN